MVNSGRGSDPRLRVQDHADHGCRGAGWVGAEVEHVSLAGVHSLESLQKLVPPSSALIVHIDTIAWLTESFETEANGLQSIINLSPYLFIYGCDPKERNEPILKALSSGALRGCNTLPKTDLLFNVSSENGQSCGPFSGLAFPKADGAGLLAVSPDGKMLATISNDGKELYFQKVTMRELDRKGPGVELSVKELAALWSDLAHVDEDKADAAWSKLGTGGDKAIAFLQQQIRPIAVPAVTTSPGSAARVRTVPSKGAVTMRSLRFSSASWSWNSA